MSRLLYRLSYPALATDQYLIGTARAPMQNRTADLLLTMETLYRLSYRGLAGPLRYRTRQAWLKSRYCDTTSEAIRRRS